MWESSTPKVVLVKEEQQAFYFACFLRSMGLNRHPGISGWYNASLLSVMPDPAENHGTRWLSRLYRGFQIMGTQAWQWLWLCGIFPQYGHK